MLQFPVANGSHKNGMTRLIEIGESSNRMIMEDEPISRNTV